MLKFVKVLSVVMAIAFLSTVSVFAAETALQYGKSPISVVKASAALKMDGKALEASWKKAPNLNKTIDHYKITATGAWKKLPAAGVASVTTLKYLWDTKNIYCFITVKDTTNYTAGAINVLNIDAVEYHLDAKNSDRISYSGKNDAQYRFSRPYKRANGQTYTDVSGWGSYNAPQFKNNCKSIGTSTTYTQEIKIPLATHGVATLKKGQKIGWDIQVNDATAQKAGRTYQLVWNSKDNAWTNPSTMGTLIMK